VPTRSARGLSGAIHYVGIKT